MSYKYKKHALFAFFGSIFLGIFCLMFRDLWVTLLTVSIILLLVAIYCIIKAFKLNKYYVLYASCLNCMLFEGLENSGILFL